MTRQMSLRVNGENIVLDHFVQGFIDHVTGGILEALEGTGKPEKVRLGIKKNTVELILNDAAVPLNTFAGKIVRSTVIGMASVLKGVSDVSTLELEIIR